MGSVRKANNTLSIKRLLNAPRELVFEVWTNPDHIKHWWGPDGFSLTTNSMDIKVNGEWKFIMHGPDGTDYNNKVRYTELLKPEHICYFHVNDDEAENISFEVMVEFKEKDGKTELTMTMTFPDEEELDIVENEFKAIEGLEQTINRLQTYTQKISTNHE